MAPRTCARGFAPPSPVELQRQVNDAIMHGAKSIIIPGGTYTFGEVNFEISGASELIMETPEPVTSPAPSLNRPGLLLSGPGAAPGPAQATFLFSGLAGVNISHCENLWLGNWTIDVIDFAPTRWCGAALASTTGGVPVAGGLDGAITLNLLNSSRVTVSARDCLHFSDLRAGPTVVDSVVGYAGDDFFNVHSTLLLDCVLCTKSCLLVKPHVTTGSRNTVYATNSVMSAAVPGDQMSFYEFAIASVCGYSQWPGSDLVPHKISSSSSVVTSFTEVSGDPLLADQVVRMMQFVNDKGPQNDWTNTTVWQPHEQDSVEVWNVSFSSDLPARVLFRANSNRTAMVAVDSI
eukprot:gene7010-1253_t